MVLLSARTVAARLSVSRTYLYRLVKDHGFPPPVKLGSRSAWREDEIVAWVEARSGERA